MQKFISAFCVVPLRSRTIFFFNELTLQSFVPAADVRPSASTAIDLS